MPLDHDALLDHLAKFVWYERARPSDANSCSKLRQKMNVRARNTRMKNVAYDCYFQASDATLALAYGQSIEQCLGRMLVRAVASVYDSRAADSRKLNGRARRRMANHN